MSTSVTATRVPFQPPPVTPPPRSREEVAAAAVERTQQSEKLTVAAAKAERAHNTGVGSVVDVMA